MARTGVCFALEVTLDALARKLGIEPNELRFKSLVRPEQMPFDNIAKRHFDCGDYPEALRRAIDAIGFDKVRERQQRGEPDGRRIGIGFAMYSEQAGHGTSVYAAWGIPFVPGYEQALARFTPDGGLELRIGAHSHGQGLETTLSQVAHSILGVPHDRIRLVHGDTAETPYSTGTWGSRCMVMAGGAVARGLRRAGRAREEDRRRAAAGQARGGAPAGRRGGGPVGQRIAVADVARTWYRRPQDLPADVDPRGLEVTAGYKAKRDTGTFSYAAHAAVVAVDPETGERRDPRLRRGRGRRHAGQPDDRRRPDHRRHRAGHRHRAVRGDARSTRRASRWPRRSPTTCCPAPPRCPTSASCTWRRPRPTPRFGQKGIGEGGAIAPPAAIANAVNDALAGLGVELLVSPITPRRIVEAIAARSARRKSTNGAVRLRLLRPHLWRGRNKASAALRR